jgi:hypothetical protein
MPVNKSRAEEFLYDNQVVGKRSNNHQQILACLACRLARNGVFHGYEAIQCRRLLSGSLYPVLNRLEEHDLLMSEMEETSPKDMGRPPRRVYTLADTALAQEFGATLDVPEDCNLD